MELYWEDEDAVQFITAFVDDSPYTCEEWAAMGNYDDNLLIDDDSQLYYDMFWLSPPGFPQYVLLDHTMTYRYNYWPPDVSSINNNIQSILDNECGELCEPCSGGTVDSDGDGISDECDDCHNLLGDIDDDGVHDILDIVKVVNIILDGGVNSDEFNDCEKTDADLDSDGSVNILDVIQLINLILGDRMKHEPGNVEVGIYEEGPDLHLSIDSEVHFSGFQIRINGEYSNITMDDNEHINLVSRVKNGQTVVIAYSVDNEPFNNNFAGINILGGSSIEETDLTIMVSSHAGEALTVLNMGSTSKTSPNEFELTSIYPNPFNPTTSISFTLSVDGKVNLLVFDVRGNQVDKLFSDNLIAGEHTFTWDASNFASGVYYIQLNSGVHSSMMKTLLMK